MNAQWIDRSGKPASSCGGTAILSSLAHQQLHKLDQLVNAALAARVDASRGNLFESMAGKALVNAAFDLFECDQLYDLREEIASGEDREISRDDINEHDADLRQGRSAR